MPEQLASSSTTEKHGEQGKEKEEAIFGFIEESKNEVEGLAKDDFLGLIEAEKGKKDVMSPEEIEKVFQIRTMLEGGAF